MPPLLARTWRGTTRAADADAYLAYLHATGLAEYAATPGNQGVLALRRVAGDGVEWLLVTLWDSPEAVRAFVGAAAGTGAGTGAEASDGAADEAALTRAVFYADDDRFLTARDERATHYEVAYAAGRALGAPPRPERAGPAPDGGAAT